MENKVPQGSLLLYNLSHGLMSNVENSLYLWDLSRCVNRASKNVLINWSIDLILNKSDQVFKNHPHILVTMRNPGKEFGKDIDMKSAQVIEINQNNMKFVVHKVNNLIILNAYPSLGNTNQLYTYLKTSQNPCDTLLELILGT